VAWERLLKSSRLLKKYLALNNCPLNINKVCPKIASIFARGSNVLGDFGYWGNSVLGFVTK